VMSSASTVESATRQPWQRLQQESSKALAAFVVFRDLGPARTYEKVSRMLQKSEPLIARWGKRHNWHHRAADWDEFNDQEMQRELRSRRVRARKRALDIADELDQKLADAVHMLKVGKVVKVDGKPDESELTISPTELARLFEVSQNIQHRILGKDEDEEIYEFHLHFNAPDPDYEHEQPEAVLAARKKAREEQRD